MKIWNKFKHLNLLVGAFLALGKWTSVADKCASVTVGISKKTPTSCTSTPSSSLMLLLPSSEAYKFTDNATIRSHLDMEHQVDEVQLTLATMGNFYSSGFVCSECGYVASTSVAFATHFSVSSAFSLPITLRCLWPAVRKYYLQISNNKLLYKFYSRLFDID